MIAIAKYIPVISPAGSCRLPEAPMEGWATVYLPLALILPPALASQLLELLLFHSGFRGERLQNQLILRLSSLF